jgi:hypothetical protein
MGTIISKIEEIDSIHWTQLVKGRPTNAKRVIALDETTVIIELENGSYTIAGRRHSPNGKWAVLGYGLDKFGKGVLDGLVRFGILTKDQVSAHLEDVKARSEMREKNYARKSLAEACKTLGIRVPKAAIDAQESAA